MYSARDHPKVGFPHSDIFGSVPVRGSPKLFAAYHVLHRLLAPRHPLNALLSLHLLLFSTGRAKAARQPLRPVQGPTPHPEQSLYPRRTSDHRSPRPPTSKTCTFTRPVKQRRPRDLSLPRSCDQVRDRRVFLSFTAVPPIPCPSPGASRRGGGERDRTDDLLLAKQALSRLSYTPARLARVLVGQGGFEPPTSRLSSARSNQLSY